MLDECLWKSRKYSRSKLFGGINVQTVATQVTQSVNTASGFEVSVFKYSNPMKMSDQHKSNIAENMACYCDDNG